MDFVHGNVLLVSSVSLESHGDSGCGSSLNLERERKASKKHFNTKLAGDRYLSMPGDSSPPLAAPGSEVSLRSEIDDTFRRDWIESVRRTEMEKITKKLWKVQATWMHARYAYSRIQCLFLLLCHVSISVIFVWMSHRLVLSLCRVAIEMVEHWPWDAFVVMLRVCEFGKIMKWKLNWFVDVRSEETRDKTHWYLLWVVHYFPLLASLPWYCYCFPTRCPVRATQTRFCVRCRHRQCSANSVPTSANVPSNSMPSTIVDLPRDTPFPTVPVSLSWTILMFLGAFDTFRVKKPWFRIKSNTQSILGRPDNVPRLD